MRCRAARQGSSAHGTWRDTILLMNLPRPFGPYTLLRRLAVGGMAEIYVAKTVGLGGFEKLVAIKLVHPHLSADPAFIQMLVDEAKILVMLTHANVAQVFDLGRIDDTYYIAMEYVEGLDVHALLKAAKRVERPLPVPVCCYVVSEVLNGLDYAHRKRDAAGKPLNIVHRDISPQNVLISAAGEVKLVDFGIAKTNLRGEGTEVGVIKGKYYYMSPEQAWADPMDRRSDIFSAGIVLYEMLTGQMLYNAKTIPELIAKVREADITSPDRLRVDIPDALNTIVMKALKREQSERYQSALDMGEALRDFLYEHAPAFNAGRLSHFVNDLVDAASRIEEALKPDPEKTGGLPALKASEFVRNENSVVFALPGGVVATRNEALPNNLRRDSPSQSTAPTPPRGGLAARAKRPSLPPLPPRIAPMPRIAPPPAPTWAAHAHQDSAPPTEIMSRPPELPRVSAWPFDAPANDAGLDEPTELWTSGQLRAQLPQNDETLVDDGAMLAAARESVSRVDPFAATFTADGDVATSKYRPSAIRATPDGLLDPPSIASLHQTGSNSIPSLTPVLPFGLGGKQALVPPPGEPHSLGPIPPSPPVPDFSASDGAFRMARGKKPWLQISIGVLFTVLGVLAFEMVRPAKNPPTLEIVSVPAGAQVKVNGAMQPHKTPIKLTGLEVDHSYELRVELGGYLPWEATYRASPGPVQHIAVLKPITAELHVSSKPTGARVFLDDVAIGRAPLTISSLPVGRKVRLRAASPGFRDARRELTISEQELMPRVELVLSPDSP